MSAEPTSGTTIVELPGSRRLHFAGQTDVGLLRDRNEDGFLLFPEFRLATVADGMGGHNAGDVASALAIDTLRTFYQETVARDGAWPFPYDDELSPEENCVVAGVRLANQQVFHRAREADQAGMGTTIVAMMFAVDGEQVVIGHVGDSRCYRIRGATLKQLTCDHSLIGEARQIAPWLTAEEVEQLPSNVITRALGMGPDVMVDLLTTEARPGDTYLLCSDGLSGLIDDARILALVSQDAPLDARCAALIDAANQAGGTDNTTVVLVHLEQHDPAQIELGDERGAPAGPDEEALASTDPAPSVGDATPPPAAADEADRATDPGDDDSTVS